MYNIYYKGQKINKKLLSDSDLQDITKQTTIYKHNKITGKIDEIPVSKIRVHKCIIV